MDTCNDDAGRDDCLPQSRIVANALERLLRLSARWAADNWLQSMSLDTDRPPISSLHNHQSQNSRVTK